eukprot:7602149-Alexandrium_andersonii.AAC.1
MRLPPSRRGGRSPCGFPQPRHGWPWWAGTHVGAAWLSVAAAVAGCGCHLSLRLPPRPRTCGFPDPGA